MSTSHGESFKETLKLLYGNTGEWDHPNWICENTFLRGKKYSFDKHEYQRAPIEDPARIVALHKCAQLGFTEVFLRWIISFLVQHQGSQAIFTQPTATDMSNFVKSRADAVLEECPVVRRLGNGGVDNVALKRIGQSFLNLRGTFGSKAAISVPSDANAYDEVNFSNPRVLSQYKSRLQHSEFKLERYISTPTVPGYGVTELFDRSDQKRIIVKCDHCSEWQFLDWPINIFFRRLEDGVTIPYDEEFFETYVERSYEYKPFIGCCKCQREVDRSWVGGHREWVAKYPERNRDNETGVSGYHLSQLDAIFVEAFEIVNRSDRRLEGYRKIEDFYNFVLARPYEGGDSVRITDALRPIAIYPMNPISRSTGTWLGIDLGHQCHIVILKDMYITRKGIPSSVPVIINAFRITKEQLEGTGLIEAIKNQGALYTVSDAQPYTTTVERTAKAHKNRMSCCYFGGKKAYALSNENVTVTANRTMLLDEVTDAIPAGNLLIASGIPDIEMVWAHLKRLVKVRAEDDDGQEYYEYVKTGDDHYGLAAGYAMLARQIWYEERPNGNVGFAPVGITGAEMKL